MKDSKKYILSFIITATIFATAVFISNSLDTKRIENIRAIEDKMSMDILSLETQFDLLENLACESINENPILSNEINSLAKRLSYMEEKLGTKNEEVIRLKRRYSLLQIKDLILMNKVAKKCNIEPNVILYFYSNEDDCDDCTKQGYVLTELSEKYSTLRVYAFDYHLDLSALKTLLSINTIKNTLPALVIDNKAHYGFTDMETIVDILPKLITEENSSEVSTTTDKSI
jgi:regulator of replication initiation timing